MRVPGIAQRLALIGATVRYPVTTAKDEYKIVQGLEIDSFSAEMIEKTKKELLEERDMVADLLKD